MAGAEALDGVAVPGKTDAASPDAAKPSSLVAPIAPPYIRTSGKARQVLPGRQEAGRQGYGMPAQSKHARWVYWASYKSLDPRSGRKGL